MNCVEIPLTIGFKLIKIDNIRVYQLLEKFVFLWKSRHSAQNLIWQICYRGGAWGVLAFPEILGALKNVIRQITFYRVNIS